jgi:hypothetical protein
MQHIRQVHMSIVLFGQTDTRQAIWACSASGGDGKGGSFKHSRARSQTSHVLLKSKWLVIVAPIYVASSACTLKFLQVC